MLSLSRTSSSAAAMMASPASTSGSRGPRLPTSRPDTGANRKISTAMGSVSRPACSALKPRVSCRYRVFRNRKPPSTPNASTAITLAPLNGTLRKKRTSSSGWNRRDSTRTSATAATAATANMATISGEPHPADGPSITP